MKPEPAAAHGRKFNLGDEVCVPVFGADGKPEKAKGVIKAVAPSFDDVVHFEVHGKELITIVSINSISSAEVKPS